MRSSQTEWAERINRSVELLSKKTTTEGVVLALMNQYEISRRQAFRYIEEAERMKHKIPVPEQKEAFTIKLPASVINRIRRYARRSGQSLGNIIKEAIERFLKRRDG